MNLSEPDSVKPTNGELAPLTENPTNGELAPLTETPTNGELAPLTENGEPRKDKSVVIIHEREKRLIYRISDNPPVHLTFMFAIQQLLTALYNSMSMSVVVAELVCARDDDEIKTKILSTTMLMSGISTFLVSTFGVRLPVYQGPSMPYIIPLLAMSTLKEFYCPNYHDSPESLSSVNGTAGIFGGAISLNETRELTYSKIQAISGGLMAAGVIHLLIGFTGLVGVFARYIGPITIVPTITLIGLSIYTVGVKFCEKHWGVAAVTTVTGLILALYLNGKNTPLPAYNRTRGFYIKWYPLHTVFALLFSVIAGWTFSAILTVSGTMSDDRNHVHHYARTDSRNDVIFQSPWLYIAYPGQFGTVGFSVAAFISCLVATLLSIIDSIGDYNATARVCFVPPPPSHAVNRGIFLEGVMSFFAGTTGACHATVSYGNNIGAIGLTKVASRRVFQVMAIMYIIFSVVLKISAVFITIPYPVLGGCMILSFGIFIGLILSNLQFIDLNSTRNLAIVGIAILLGLMLPYWTERNQDAIKTGNAHIDNIFLTLISNGGFVGGFVAFFLDNTVQGTLKDRGLDINQESLDEGLYEEGYEVYEFQRIPRFITESRIYKLLPIFSKKKIG
ncbi:solute carrier family 23 member 2 isoform X2 [Patella vulgata]|nr:solute carrier family 23 member 2 isoform X2 [Patella vulgata]